MIDHFTLTVSDLARSKAFYLKVLAPLGYTIQKDYGEMVGFGDVRPYFFIKQGPTPTQPMHIAFKAASRGPVDDFYKAALAAGAKDDGKPGIRKQYHHNYYAAFVLDPDGHPVEAVCHAAVTADWTKT